MILHCWCHRNYQTGGTEIAVFLKRHPWFHNNLFTCTLIVCWLHGRLLMIALTSLFLQNLILAPMCREPQFFQYLFPFQFVTNFFEWFGKCFVWRLSYEENLKFAIVVTHWRPQYTSNLNAPLRKCEKEGKINVKNYDFNFNKIIIFALINFYKQVMTIDILCIHTY